MTRYSCYEVLSPDTLSPGARALVDRGGALEVCRRGEGRPGAPVVPGMRSYDQTWTMEP